MYDQAQFRPYLAALIRCLSIIFKGGSGGISSFTLTREGDFAVHEHVCNEDKQTKYK